MAVSRWIIGIILTGILIWLVDIFVGWRYVWESWRLVSVIVVQKFLLLFALSHAIRAWRIYLFKSQSLGLGYGLTIKLSLVHQSLNNLLPMRLGEASYPLLMRRYSSVSLMDATFDLLWLRVLDFIVMGSLSIFVVMSYASPPLATAAMFVFLGGGCAVLSWARFVSAGTQPSIGNQVTMMSVLRRLGGRGPSTMGRLCLLLVLTICAWAAKIAAIVILAAALTDLPWLTLIGGIVAGEVSGVLPVHGIAGAGTYEAAFVAGAIAGGDAFDKLLLTSVSVHVFVISTTCLLALFSLPLGGHRTQV